MRVSLLVALTLVTAGGAGCIGNDDNDGGLGATAGADDGGPDRQTETADAEVQLSAGAIEMCLITPTTEKIAETRPGNLTGVLLELEWTSTATKDLGIGSMRLNATVDGEQVNATAQADDDGLTRLWVLPEDWQSGVLEATYCADGTAMAPNAIVLGNATLYATLFTGGPPDWGFSAA